MVDIHLCPPYKNIYKYSGHKDTMAYTEIQEKKGKRYYYRVKSIKKNKKVSKKKIYLGINLNKENLIKRENFENRYEVFCSLFTHNSTAIEGNTLTLLETSYLLFDGIVPKEKSLREINE